MRMQIGLLVGLMSASSLAMPENLLQDAFHAEILWSFEAQSEAGSFIGKNGVPIAYRKFEVQDEKGALVILPGRGEPMHKYAELIFDLKDLGYSMYIMSHRGQGESGRIDDMNMQYVESYTHYTDDLKTFMELHVSAKPRVVLLGHSMGAAIGTLYALKHPNAFAGMILSSPMFGVKTPDNKEFTIFAANTKVNGGYGKKLAGEDNLQVTSSMARQEITNRVLNEHSSIESSKISWAWAKASFDVIKEIRHADLSSLPFVLMLQAGNDLHVPAYGQNKVCNRMKACEKVSFPASFHEILMESDPIRNNALEKIRGLLSGAAQ